MQDLSYLIGILFAIGAGVMNNFGLLCQKKAVNELPEGEKVGRNLLKKPLWVFGLILEMVVGTTLFILAYSPEWGIGAALVPGLMAAGLIVLAIGSIRILGENLTKQEVLGILLMIVGITLLGFSELETEVTELNLQDAGFIFRATIFTVILISIAIFCEIFQRKQKKYKGILLAIFSGTMFGISNFWVAPMIALIGIVFGSGRFIVLFIICAVILILSNIYGIFKIQQAFQHGQASNLIPIQQMPIQIAPIFVYFSIFLLVPPEIYSFPFMIIAILLIIISSFLLAQRQAQLEKIK